MKEDNDKNTAKLPTSFKPYRLVAKKVNPKVAIEESHLNPAVFRVFIINSS